MNTTVERNRYIINNKGYLIYNRQKIKTDNAETATTINV
jgi:hypothetical protein